MEREEVFYLPEWYEVGGARTISPSSTEKAIHNGSEHRQTKKSKAEWWE